MKLLSIRLFCICLAACSFAAAPVEYLRDVKPVLAEHCYRCHGAAQQKSGLRLDTAKLALKGGEHGPAFNPGHGPSLLAKILRGTHPDLARMPYKQPPLSEAQIVAIEQWIAEGAKAPADEAPEAQKHWAFIAPVRATPPPVKQTDWPRNEIDLFVLSSMERQGIKPAPEATRFTLIRRLSLDLIGLPPAPAEVDEFI